MKYVRINQENSGKPENGGEPGVRFRALLSDIAQDPKKLGYWNLISGTIAGASFAVLEQISAFWGFMRDFRPAAFVLFLAALAMYLFTLYRLAKTGDGTVKRIDRIPFELLIVLYFIAIAVVLAVFGGGLLYSVNTRGAMRMVLLLGGVMILILNQGLARSIARRAGSGRFAEYSLIGRLAGKVNSKRQRTKGNGVRHKSLVDIFYEKTTFIGRINLLLALIFVAQMLVLQGFRINRKLVLLYLIYKFIETAFIYAGLLQLDRIRRGTLRIAEGNYAEPIPTRHMYRGLREYTGTLNSIGEGFSAAVEERLKSERMRTELITNVSHDIKTPLTSIISYVDLMDKEEIQSEKAREYLEVLKRQSGKLKKLVEDLVEASRASTGNIEMHPEDCDLRIILDQAVGEFADRMQARNLTLCYAAPDEPVCVHTDGRYLWRVFDNLLGNVCKYAMPGSRVYMNQSSYGDRVIVEIKNMSEQSLNISADELMERFVRGDASRNTEGSGLGLSIADSLMRLMGGKLTITVDGDLFKAAVEIPSAGPAA